MADEDKKQEELKEEEKAEELTEDELDDVAGGAKKIKPSSC